ncbi:MAG: hypothetical protein RL045_625, partial [Bacteroidota bacterium]
SVQKQTQKPAEKGQLEQSESVNVISYISLPMLK